MVVTALLLAAEALLFSMPLGDRDPLHMAKSYLQFLCLRFAFMECCPHVLE